MILKLHGGVDRRPERGRRELRRQRGRLHRVPRAERAGERFPVTLAAKLRRSHLLFISYPVVEWSLRVFLHRVFGDEPISYRSWAVLPGAQPIQHEFWRQRGVDLYDVRSTTSWPTSSAASTEVALGMNLESPYKGLVPFEDSELDALLFFGRERESEIIAARTCSRRG